MHKTSLYREQALKANQGKWLGEILLISPMHSKIMVFFSFSFLLCGAALMYFGTYAKHVTVSGLLTPKGGVIKIYAAQSGVVLKRMVGEGDLVKKGQALYLISSERQSEHITEVQSSISQQAQLRRQSYIDDYNNKKIVQKEERDAMLGKLHSLESSQNKLFEQISIQNIQISFAKNTWERYKQLQQRGYINAPQVEEKQQAMLELQSRLHGLERDLINARAELASGKSELTMLKFKQNSSLALLDREMATAVQEYTESEAKRELVVTAPQSGIATGVFAEVGHAVDAVRPLLSIAGSGDLQVRLYVPTKLIGSVKKGDVIRLKYQAFPYQRFGFGGATVFSISGVAFEETELADLRSPPVGRQSSDSIYVVDGKLQSQVLGSEAVIHNLRAGMTVEADIVQERHRLMDWVFSPLKRLKEIM